MQSKELEKEILEIKISAEEIGIYLKGLTGQKSYLSEYEWLLVRTNLFKEEFGDWEQYFKCKLLLEHPVVSILTGEEFAPIEGKTLTDQVEEYFIRLGGKVISPFFGEVTLDRKGADDNPVNSKVQPSAGIVERANAAPHFNEYLSLADNLADAGDILSTCREGSIQVYDMQSIRSLFYPAPGIFQGRSVHGCGRFLSAD